jgi:hypothetical protein
MEDDEDDLNNNDFNNYLEEILDNYSKNSEINWKFLFGSIKSKLLFEYKINSNSDIKFNSLLFLQKLLTKLNHTDFEIKVFYNDLVNEMIPLINDHNVIDFLT